MIPLRQSKTQSCRFDQYERTRAMQNTTLLLSFLNMTMLSPLLRRKRRAQMGGGPLDDPLDISMARSQGLDDFGPRIAADSLPYFPPVTYFLVILFYTLQPI